MITGGRKLAEGTARELMARTSAASLDEAFRRLTGAPAARDLTADFLAGFGPTQP